MHVFNQHRPMCLSSMRANGRLKIGPQSVVRSEDMKEPSNCRGIDFEAVSAERLAFQQQSRQDVRFEFLAQGGELLCQLFFEAFNRHSAPRTNQSAKCAGYMPSMRASANQWSMI